MKNSNRKYKGNIAYAKLYKISLFINLFILLVFGIQYARGQKNSKEESMVTFAPDSSLFKRNEFFIDPINPELRYSDSYGVNYNSGELRKDSTLQLSVSGPTFVNLYGSYLVFPGEKIGVQLGEKDENPRFKIDSDSTRTKELAFLNELNPILQRIIDNANPFLVSSLRSGITLDSIQESENKFKNQLPAISEKTGAIFDSLSASEKLSERFTSIAKPYISRQILYSLWNYYNMYADTLKQHKLYKEKVKSVLPYFKNIQNPYEVEGIDNLLTDILNALVRKKLYRLNGWQDIQETFDTIHSYFNGYAEKFLQTKILIEAIRKNEIIPENYLHTATDSTSNPYHAIVWKAIAEKSQKENTLKQHGSNSILSHDGQTITNLDSVIEQSKGYLLYIDFWATWCVPCLQELPYSQRLEKKYQKRKIIFLYISSDRDSVRWRQFIQRKKIRKNSYLLLNSSEAEFMKQHKIETIPRYFLISKTGKLISSNAPRPSDPALIKLIHENL